jgi:hypothetical protein
MLEQVGIEIIKTFPKALSGIEADQAFGATLLNRWWQRACVAIGVSSVSLYPGYITMKIYTEQEARRLFREHPIEYAEIAHQYPCCDLPQGPHCAWCDKGVWCDKIKGFTTGG